MNPRYTFDGSTTRPRSPVMDLFETLPAELLVPVLRNLPDLGSLYNIARASPRVFHFLNGSLGAAILEHILDSWCGVILDHPGISTGVDEGFFDRWEASTTLWVSHILRLIALVRSCSSTNPVAENLTSFTLKYVMPTKTPIVVYPHVTLIPPSCLPTIRLQDVTGGDQALSTREMLCLIRKIVALTDECFHFFHDRIKATQPQHLIRKLSDTRYLGSSYKFDVGGEVSYYEYQHILHGFCSLQLRYELNNAVQEGRLAWSPDDIEAIRGMNKTYQAHIDYEKPEVCFSWEPLSTAAIYVASLEGVPDESSSVGDVALGRNGLRVFYDTGLRPLKGGHLKLPRPKHEDTRFTWPTTVIRQPPPSRTFLGHCYRLMFAGEGAARSPNILISRNSRYITEGLLFRPFRRLGLNIWDDDRLLRMEMVYGPSCASYIANAFTQVGNYDENLAFTWASLLSPKEKDELRAYQQMGD
ncbi:uncharacterized protein B0J16DRAFT_404206 [Fusarium flagelliforme]|uniref:uncharacterized protein n=1 Tax=Fusarium flagelliforme TaxID=2675880 RepID=UPI001E8E3C55|nr:uncharacterized protein B0J16DRAFT_404206 [Fusarium flagelliforme]KAH7174507.1 hypothetical protein B0J16DRAFT_404206 [Fusarium flagelliforme]